MQPSPLPDKAPPLTPFPSQHRPHHPNPCCFPPAPARTATAAGSAAPRLRPRGWQSPSIVAAPAVLQTECGGSGHGGSRYGRGGKKHRGATGGGAGVGVGSSRGVRGRGRGGGANRSIMEEKGSRGRMRATLTSSRRDQRSGSKSVCLENSKSGSTQLFFIGSDRNQLFPMRQDRGGILGGAHFLPQTAPDVPAAGKFLLPRTP